MSENQYTAPARPVILIADDYVDALPAWELFLNIENFDVITASTGPEALSSATSSAPDLIVLDLVLPGLSGCDVARTLRGQDRTRHIPMIAATGFSDPARLNEARLAGFDAVLVKPCDPAVLVAKIRELLSAPATSRAIPSS